MDAKSKLQQKVLALKRGYTAKDIKYVSTCKKNDKWWAAVQISHINFSTTGLFNSKRQAETAAAQKGLDCWSKVLQALCGNTFYKEEEEEQERWNSDEESSTSSNHRLSQEEYAEIGYRVYDIFLLMQKKT